MPLVYRAMRADPEDSSKPELAASGRALGVRPADIPVDGNGDVAPGTGGMSVSPTWRDLPGFRIPMRLRATCNKAAGPNDNYCWRMGDGPFQAAAVTSELNLRPDPQRDTHGFIEPARIMSHGEYEKSLADTQDQWTIDEA